MSAGRHPPFLLFVLAVVVKGFALTLAVDRELGLLFFPLSIAAALAVGAPALLLGGRAQALLLLAVDALISVLLLADLLVLRGMGDVVSAASFSYADQVVDIRDEVVDLLRGTDALLFVDLPLFLGVALAPRRFRRRWQGAIPFRRIAATVAIAVVAVVVTERLDPTRNDQFRGHARWIRRYGPLTYHAADLARTVWGRINRPAPAPDQLRAMGSRLADRAAAAGNLTGAAEGLDLIVVQVESLQAFAMGLRIDGAPVTPNLDRLAGESLVFTEFYEQTGVGRTADADFLVNCSQYPLATGSVYYEYPDNDYRCLPRLLADAGYRTAAFQGIRPDFWNLRLVYPRLGFQRFDHVGEYEKDEWIGLGLSDATFLRQTAVKLRNLPEPFYAYVVTLSSHTPFAYPEIPRTLRLGDLENTKEGAYLDAIRYTDAALGRFVEELAAGGLLERSLLVVYGDHFGLRVGRSELLARLVGVDRGDAAAWHGIERRVPFLLRFPGGAHAGVVATPTGQIDVAPTLLHLLGVPAGDAPFFGSDGLAATATTSFLAFPDGSVQGQGLLWLPRGARSTERDGCFDLATRQEVDTDRCRPLAAWASDELDVSELLIRANVVPPREAGDPVAAEG